MVNINLDNTVKRPALSLRCPTGPITCLIDTGAIMSVWCLPLFLFKNSFPEAEKTKFRTTVSGFGGVSYKKRDVWKIPVFVLEDPNGEGSYVIKNMLIAIVDDSRITAFNMILSSLIFRGSSYRIFDKINDKRIEIYPEYERPVVCIPGETIDRKTLDEDIIDSLKLEKDEILISGITVFADDSIKA